MIHHEPILGRGKGGAPEKGYKGKEGEIGKNGTYILFITLAYLKCEIGKKKDIVTPGAYSMKGQRAKGLQRREKRGKLAKMLPIFQFFGLYKMGNR